MIRFLSGVGLWNAPMILLYQDCHQPNFIYPKNEKADTFFLVFERVKSLRNFRHNPKVEFRNLIPKPHSYFGNPPSDDPRITVRRGQQQWSLDIFNDILKHLGPNIPTGISESGFRWIPIWLFRDWVDRPIAIWGISMERGNFFITIQKTEYDFAI